MNLDISILGLDFRDHCASVRDLIRSKTKTAADFISDASSLLTENLKTQEVQQIINQWGNTSIPMVNSQLFYADEKGRHLLGTEYSIKMVGDVFMNSCRLVYESMESEQYSLETLFRIGKAKIDGGESEIDAFCDIKTVLNQLTDAFSINDLLSEALDVISVMKDSDSIADTLSTLQSRISNRFPSMNTTMSLYYENVLGIFGDIDSDLPTKLSHIMGLVTGGVSFNGITNTKPNNDFSDVTGVSPLSALFAKAEPVFTTIVTVVEQITAIVASLVNSLLGGALQKIGDLILVGTGVRDAFYISEKASRDTFSQYCLRAKIPLNGMQTWASLFATKLQEHQGYYLVIPTPFAYVSLKLSGGYMFMDINWRPVLPNAFDSTITTIQSSWLIYDTDPGMMIPQNYSDAQTLLDSLEEVSIASHDSTINSDYLMWKGIWLSMWCFTHWIYCVSTLLDEHPNVSYATVMMLVFTGGRTFNEYAYYGGSGTQNVDLAKLLCGDDQSTGYKEWSNLNQFFTNTMNIFFNVLSSVISDQNQWYPYYFNVSPLKGKYVIYTDSALAGIGLSMLVGATVAIAATACAILASKLTKLSYKLQVESQAMSWELLNKDTGKITDLRAINKCRKKENLANFVGGLSQKLKGASKEAVSEVADKTNPSKYSLLIPAIAGTYTYDSQTENPTIKDVIDLIH